MAHNNKRGGKNTEVNRAPVVEVLEPRILFSADLPGIELFNAETTSDPDWHEVLDNALAEFERAVTGVNDDLLIQPSDFHGDTGAYELVIIDPSVEGYQTLIDSLREQQLDGRDLTWHVLDSERDGIEQLTELLSQHENLSAVHLFAHGGDGVVQLGATQLQTNDLNSHASEVSSWRHAFLADGDFLIYGCDLASSDTGVVLLETLAELTATDVAASEDLTGIASQGGDWDLEYTRGLVEAPSVVSPSVQDSWQVKLDIPGVNDAPTFDAGDGTITTPFGAGNDSAWSSAIQSDGKIIVVGRALIGSDYDFAVARYNVDGSLDTSFSGDGMLTLDFNSDNDYAFDVTVQSDGKILVAGSKSNAGNNDFALVRFNTDGTLDTSFGGGDGIQTTAIGSGSDRGWSLSLQTDGKILLAGVSHNGSNDDFALVRYNTDGSLDSSFSGDGILTTAVGAANDSAYAVTVQADGKILVTGRTYNGSNFDIGVVRYNTNGTLDSSFSGDGIQTTAIGASDDVAASIAVQTDGKIVVAGESFSAGYEFAVVRYNTNGTLDTSFSGDGKLTTDIGTGSSYGKSISIQPDGQLVVAGYSVSGSDYTFAVARYNTDGTLDTSFDSDGILSASVGSGNDFGRDLSIQSDGSILVVGGSNNGSDEDFGILSLSADGSLDTSFGLMGSLDGSPSYIEGGGAVVLDTDVNVSDAELDALNSSNGNYDGASVTLIRNGGVSSEDVFSFNDGNGITLSGTDLIKNSQTIATFDLTSTPGELLITWTDANGETPTSADVDNILRQITYANSSDSPPSSVQVDWTFNDGNAGSQGSGAALTTLGSTIVSIIATNDAPILTSAGAVTRPEGTGHLPFNGLTVADVDSPDFDGGTLAFSDAASIDSTDTFYIVPIGGVSTSGADVLVSGVTVGSFVGGSGGTALVFSFNSNATLASVQSVYQAVAVSNSTDNPASGTRNIEAVLTDGDGGISNTATATITITAVNDDPTNAGALPTDINVTEDVSSNVDLSAIDLNDVDAGGSSLTVTLSTSTGGDLTAAAGTGITIGGTSTARTLTGNLTDLNNYFNTVSNITYLHGTANQNGDNADTIQINVNDNGNTGTGGGGSIDFGTVNVDISVVNDAPLAVPDSYTVLEDGSLTTTLLPSFGSEQIVTNTADAAQSATAADVDGDGDLDVLVASWNDNTVAWYENTDGMGTYGPKQVISTTLSIPRWVTAADVDGDGDLDVLATSLADDTVAWFENTDGSGTFGAMQVITNGADQARLVTTADADGDGDLDVFVASTADNTIAWYENTDGLGTFGAEQVITNSAAATKTVAIGDIDGDGDVDVLSASEGDGTVAWYENTDGLGTFGAKQVITNSAAGAHFVVAADVDGDGDLDVLSASYADDTVAWFENTDGLGAFGVAQVISNTADHVRMLAVADMDGDGDLDVLSASEFGNTVAWYENTDGLGAFGAELVVSNAFTGVHTVIAADINSDGNLDVLAASSGIDTVAWFESTNSDVLNNDSDADSETLTLTAVLVTDVSNGTLLLNADGTFTYTPDADFNGVDSFTYKTNDGTVDSNTVLVTLNVTPLNDDPTNAGSLPTDIAVTEDISSNVDLSAIDLADVDASSGSLTVTLSTSTGGDLTAASGTGVTVSGTSTELTLTGNLTDLNNYLNTVSNITYLHATPEAEGDNADTIQVNVNDNGNAGTGGGTDIDLGTVNVDIEVANDGPLATPDSYTLLEDGSLTTTLVPTFGAEQVISNTSDGAFNITAADLDGDGDLDLLATSISDDTVAWYENTDGLGTFGPEQVITNSADRSFFVKAVDLDGDGDLDVLAASVVDGTVSWFENTNGLGSFGPEQVIATLVNVPREVTAADLDGDGDLDVLATGLLGDTVTWYENTDGLGSFGPEQVITNTASGAFNVIAADLDGDGDLDVLATAFFDNTVVWFENTNSLGSFGPGQVITNTANGAQSVTAADVDGDGDLDVLVASSNDDTVSWFENTNGLGAFGSAQVITTTADAARSVTTADMDGDGDLDVVVGSENDGTVAWYENTDGLGTFGSEQVIAILANGPTGVAIADVNGDGALDVLAASPIGDTFLWFENVNAPTLINDTDIDGDPLTAVLVTDVSNGTLVLNADGTFTYTPDANFNGVDSFTYKANDGAADSNAVLVTLNVTPLNDDPTNAGSLPTDIVVTEDISSNVDLSAIDLADVDASSGSLTVTLTTSTGGDLTAAVGTGVTLGGTSTELTLTGNLIDLNNYLNTASNITYLHGTPGTNGNNADSIQVAVNDNGNTGSGGGTNINLGTVNVDITAVNDAPAATADSYTLLEDGTLTTTLQLFGSEQVISNTSDGVVSVVAADVDGDGDLDVLVGSSLTDTVAWFENIDGFGTFGAEQVITNLADSVRSVKLVDIDGDGDMDVLVASLNDDTVAWFENTDGLGTFGSEQVITNLANGANSVTAADIDGDGDLDVLVASNVDDTVAWFENTDGLGVFGSEQVITNLADGANSVVATDVDGDGDLDVLIGSFNDDTVAWFENTDGLGAFGAEQVITLLADGVQAIESADVDGDGDQDVIVASRDDDTIAWFENTDGLGTFGVEQIIPGSSAATRSLVAADVDGDGDLDLLAASFDNNTVGWFENTDGLGTFDAMQIIANSADGARSVVAADMDGDGDLDVVVGSRNDDTVAWFENNGGPVLNNDIDIDVDSLTAVLVTNVSNGTLLLNADGTFTYTPDAGFNGVDSFTYKVNDGFSDSNTVTVTLNVTAVNDDPANTGSLPSDISVTEDVSSNVDLSAIDLSDVDAGGSSLTVTLATSTGGNLTAAVGTGITIGGASTARTLTGNLTDLNNYLNTASNITYLHGTPGTNGDNADTIQVNVNDNGNIGTGGGTDIDLGTVNVDIAAVNNPPVSNPDIYHLLEDDTLATTLQTFGSENVITASADFVRGISSADIDGDGDLDVLAASVNDNSVTWFENIDGLGTFGAAQVITNAANGAISVTAADIDGDGDMDVVVASLNDNTVAWFENTDGLGAFGSEQVLSNTMAGAIYVTTADVDGDGDQDVMAASRGDDTVAWFENTDGLGTFGSEQVLTNTADSARWVVPADMDGDGDLDAVIASVNDDTVAWFENTDGLGTFGAKQVISNIADGADAVAVADVDGDGDLDVIATAFNDDSVSWYENIDGAGTFGAAQLLSNSVDGVGSVAVVDVDGDGDVDVLVTGEIDNSVVWFENTDGLGTFEIKKVISSTSTGAIFISPADLDGDGDLDFLVASQGNDTAAWFENVGATVVGNDTDADSDTLTAVLVTDVSNGTLLLNADGTFTYTPDADFNGIDSFTYKANDGTVDSNTVLVTLNVTPLNDDPTNAGGFPTDIAVTEDISSNVDLSAIELTDVDASSGSLTVTLATSTGGDLTAAAGTGVTFGGTSTELTLTGNLTDLNNYLNTASNITYLHGTSGTNGNNADTIQVNVNDNGNIGTGGGTDIDLGTVSVDIAAVNNAPSLRPPSFISHDISTSENGARFVTTADVDGDGDMDVLSATSIGSTIVWYENDGSENFTLHTISTTAANAQSVVAADVDGDGDIDVLSASYNDDKIAWYENDGSENFTLHTISNTANGATSVNIADVDGDGDMDVLSSSSFDDKIAWYENDGSEGFTLHTVSTTADGAQSVTATDVDGDGDIDLLSASYNDDTIAWYENDGSESFTFHAISTTANGARWVHTIDVDGDGDMDVLSASYIDDTIAWYENDGSENFTLHIISNTADGARSVHATDVDGDGDIDVLSASFNDDTIAWYENDGSENFTPHAISITANGAYSVAIADVDGDGALDVLSASYHDDSITWYEQAVLTVLGGAPSYTEGGAAVVLDGSVSVSDAELDSLNSGNGNYNGASVTLDRNGGVNTDDVFSFSDGNGITLSGSNLIKNSQVIATFDLTTTPGELLITWTDANVETPTSNDVDNILRQITYTNSSDAPPSSVQIDWTFADGNTGSQGGGGALTALGASMVSIIAVNDAPSSGEFGVYLSTLTPLAQSNFFGGARFDTDYYGTPIDMEGVIYDYGLSTHAPGGAGVGTIDYSIGSATHFVATLGIDNNANSAGDVVFRVLVDGVEVYNSGTVNKADESIEISVDVSGGSVLRLEVGNADGSNGNDHAVWGNARLEGGDNALASIDENSANGTVVAYVTGNDVDSPDSFTYSLADDAGGRFAINSTGEVSVANGLLLDSETNPSHSIDVLIADTDGAFTTQTLAMTIANVDDETATVVNQSTTVTEGASNIALTTGDLSSNDTDTDNITLIYTVGNVSNGSLSINGSAWVGGTNDSFTQQDIIDGNVLYTNDGSNATADSFTYTVEDPSGNQLVGQTFSITVTAVDDETPTVVNQSTTVSEGATNVALANGDLSSTDTDTDGTTLIYTVGDVSNGTLTISGSVWASGTNDSFTQQDIIDGNVLYSHDDSNTTSDSFSYTIEDPTGNTLSGQAFSITVTAVDDDTATVVSQSATVAEGATNIALSSGDLSSTDTDTNDTTLIYTAADVSNGTLTINGSVWASGTNDSFTQQDINDGNVLYTHDGSNTIADSFTYTVEDPSGNQLAGQAFGITVTAVDDDIPTVVNQSTAAVEGATNIALTSGDLSSTDADTDDTTLIYTVGDVSNGTLTINGSVWASGTNDSFTQQDTVDGKVLYTHDDSNTTSDSFSYTVEDPSGNQLAGQTFSITITAVDDDTPIAVSQSTTVVEGATNIALTIGDLSSSDTDTVDSTLIYTVGDVSNGTLTINGSAWASGTNDSFSQQDIIDGNVLYSHDDSNATSDSFSYTVEDPSGNQLIGQIFGITITSVDDDTPTVGNQSATVAEGATNIALSSGDLSSTDTDTNDTTLIYTVADVSNGTLTINGSVWASGTNDSFTQQDTVDGKVLYTHDDSNTTSDSFSYTVEDPSGNQLTGQTFGITITALDDDTPTVINQSTTVAEGVTNIALSSGDLSSTDTDTDDTTLIYTVGDVSNGTLTINGSVWASGTNDSFAQQDIVDGNVLYTHDGSNTTADSFSYTVEDPAGNTLSGQTFGITITAVDDDTPAVINQSTTVSEGVSNSVLTTGGLSSTDTDTDDTTLIYTVTDVSNGTLTINGSVWASGTNDSFAQQDIIDGNILYTHDGSNATTDSFAYTVEDPAGSQLTGQTFAITVSAVDDDTPIVVKQSTTVAEGVTSVALTIGDLSSSDSDTDDTTLIYTVGDVINGTLTINGSVWAGGMNDSFTQQDVLDGNVLYSHDGSNTTADSFGYTVGDPAGNQLIGQTFGFTVTAVDDDTPSVVNQSTTVAEGATNIALASGDLSSTDTDTDDSTLIYVVGDVSNGTLTINGSVWAGGTNDSFTQQDIIDGNVLYSHDDSNTTDDSFSYMVEDPAGNQLTGQTFGINVTAVDDDTPSVIDQSTTVAEGAINIALISGDLSSTDADTDDSTLIYTVGNVSNGMLTINGSAWASGTNDSFAQQDIIDGNILYTHDGSNTIADSFTYTVEDPAGNPLTGQTFGITVTAVDDDMPSVVNQSTTVAEGATNIALSSDDLSSTDADTDDTTLIYTVADVSNGTLIINGNVWASGTNDSFSQQDIIDGNVLYSHDDSNATSDSFSYAVEDPSGNQLIGQIFGITITSVDDDTPTVGNQSATVAEGAANIVLTIGDLSSYDTDTDDTTLIYTVGDVSNGTLTINGSAWAVGMNDSFTQQDIIDENVLYTHDGSNVTADSFSYTVEDPTGNRLAGQNFGIAVTAVDDDTATVVNQSTAVAEGASNITLTTGDLSSTDTDTDDTTLIYTVGNVSSGTLTINGSVWASSTNDSFTQQDVFDGNVLYTHDGSNTTSDGFSYRIEDSAGNQLAGQTFGITVTSVDDDAPASVNQSTTVAEGATNIALTTGDLSSTDSNTDDTTLIYSVGDVSNGTLTINGSAWVSGTNDSFTQRDIIDGNVLYSHDGSKTTSDSFSYTVEDPTGNTLSGQKFSITVSTVEYYTPTVVNQSTTILEGENNVVLDTIDLSSTDGDTDDATLIYTVGNVSNGTLIINGSIWASGSNDSFTQQDIIDGNVQYAHNGSNTSSDSFSYTLKDTDGNVLEGQIFSISVSTSVPGDIEPPDSNQPPILGQGNETDENTGPESPGISLPSTSEPGNENQTDLGPESIGSNATGNNPDRLSGIDGLSENPVPLLVAESSGKPSFLEGLLIDPIPIQPSEALSEVLSERTSNGVIEIQVVQKPTALSFLQELRLVWSQANNEQVEEERAIHIDTEFMLNLEHMRRSIDKSLDDESRRLKLTSEAVVGLGIGLSACLFSWMFRAGSLLASFLSVMPVWRNFDPLPVLSTADSNRNKVIGNETRKDDKSSKDQDKQLEGQVEDLFTR